MSKNDDFKMKVKTAFYYFSKEKYIECAGELKKAGDMVLRRTKKKKPAEQTNGKMF